MQFNKDQVVEFLPHRDPFLFIDSIEKILVPDGVEIKELTISDYKPLISGEVVANFMVEETLPCFKGHFPGMPIFPGVLQLEMMAQSCAFLLSACKQFETKNTQMEVAFMSIDSVRFRKKVVPPMALRIHSQLKKVRGTICQYDCKVMHGDELVAQAVIMASLQFKK